MERSLALLAIVSLIAACGDSGDDPSGGSGGGGGDDTTSSGGGGQGNGGTPANGGAGGTQEGGAATGGAATGGSSSGGAAQGGGEEGGAGGEGGGNAFSPELCPMPSMPDLYPGNFPPNPYGDLFDADACVSQPHDVAIVLGCPNNDDGTPASCQTERADIAAQLLADGYVTKFITTGGAVHNQYVEAETLRDLLVARGISSSDIYLDPLAQHTDENIYYSTQIMNAHGWKSALVVSEDPGHLVNTAVCDSNCCVDLGRLTIVELPPTGVVIGHYALYPEGQQVTQAECDFIEPIWKGMCFNLSSRLACKDNFQL